MMAQSKVKYPASLHKYYVINTSWGNEEGNESEKSVYYWCDKGPVSEKEKMSDSGLAQAVIHFVNNFTFGQKDGQRDGRRDSQEDGQGDDQKDEQKDGQED